MRNRVVTIFGGSGFIGRYVVGRLAELGATIRVPTRHPERANYLQPMGAVGQVVIERWDAGSPEAPARLMAGSTDVVNLIGILAERRQGDYAALQGRLPGQIGTAATAAGATRLVQISAIGADKGSSSHYASSKAEGEEAVRAAFPAAVVLRPSIVFGPEDQFFNRFASLAQRLPALPLIGGGHTRFQPVYVGDVASAVVAALGEDGPPARTFELGGPRIYTFRELMQFMLKVLGRRRFLLPVPFGLASFQASLLQRLPDPPLTVEQVELLKRDNVVTAGAATLADLGIRPTPLEVIVPGYLQTYATVRARIPIA